MQQQPLMPKPCQKYLLLWVWWATNKGGLIYLSPSKEEKGITFVLRELLELFFLYFKNYQMHTTTHFYRG